ncbi:MAG: hypothetical protein ACK4WM_02670 [Thermoflexales bacterium]
MAASVFGMYARALVRRWWLVMAPPLVVFVLTQLTAPPPKIAYQVTMSFAVGLPPEPLRAETYNFDRHYNWLASEYITQGFSLIIGKGAFADAVTRRLAKQDVVLPRPLLGAIRSEYRSSVMVVYVTWDTPELAERIARAVVDELNENYEAYWPQLSGAAASPVRLMDTPQAVPLALPLRDRFDLPVRLAAALGGGVLLALVAHALDARLADRPELEQLGLRVLVEVPRDRSTRAR